SDVHHLFLEVRSQRILLSTAGNNAVATALITQQPRRLRDLISVLTPRDSEHLTEVESGARASANAASRAHREAASAAACGGNDSDASDGDGPPRKRAALARSEPDDGEATASRAANGVSSDYVYECRTQVVAVREESASLFILVFESEHDVKNFKARFTRAASDYSAARIARAQESFLTPQPVARLLFSGQIVPSPQPTLRSSPYAGNPSLAHQLASLGLVYTPVVPDGPGPATVQDRCVCFHCHAVVTLPPPSTPGASPPPASAVARAHQAHPLASYAPSAAAAAGDKKAPAAKGYYCQYAFGRRQDAGGLPPPTQHKATGTGRAKQVIYDPVPVESS
ncbi:hypothetical protein HK405_014405, partial [Cladochytrium tenue]